MRTTIAALTLSASLAISGVLGKSAEVRAELIAGTIVDATVDVTASPTREPAELELPAQSPGDGEQTSEHTTTAANPALELLFRDRPRPRPEPGADPLPADGPRRPHATQSAAMERDWTWDLDFRESVRPLYEELAAAGIVDAVGGLKSYLELSAPSPFDVPATQAYGAPPEPASWGNLSGDPGHQQRTALQREKDELLNEIMIKELIETAKPWIFGLAALYLLWQLTRLWLDYSLWRSTRAQKRSTRAKRRYHSPPPDTQEKPRLTRQRRLLR